MQCSDDLGIVFPLEGSRFLLICSRLRFHCLGQSEVEIGNDWPTAIKQGEAAHRC